MLKHALQKTFVFMMLLFMASPVLAAAPSITTFNNGSTIEKNTTIKFSKNGTSIKGCAIDVGKIPKSSDIHKSNVLKASEI